MTDPNIKDFYGRVARIERAHAHGFGHEAEGTLGRAAHLRHRTRGRSLPYLRGSVFVMATLIGLKATIYEGLGEETYLSRVASLKQGTAIERVAASVMSPDPVTAWIADAWRQVAQGKSAGKSLG